MKGEWLRVKDDHPTPLSLQLSAHKDATPAQRWHFLPRCAEGRRVWFLFFFIQREIFSFPRRRLFTETIPGEGAFDSPSAAKTHTKRKRRKG